MAQEHDPFCLENLRILGRYGEKKPLRLYWTGSGLEMLLCGSELSVELEVDYGELEPWISLMVNGRLVSRQMLPRGRYVLPLLRGLDKNRPHHLFLYKESQPMPTDRRCGIAVHSLRFDGELSPLPEPRYRLEFIGDSLTSAEGCMGSPADAEWRPIWFAGAMGYPWQTARLLRSEARVLSQSGWGVRSAWDNDPACALPHFYHQVCGVVPDGGLGGDGSEHVFSSWKPDAVLCALGANDMNAMGNTAYTDPATGKEFKQSADDTAPLQADMVAFLRKLRLLNPQAKLFWIRFGERSPINSVIGQAMEEYKAQSADESCALIDLPPMQPTGARNHPGLDVHTSQAQALSEKLRRLL